MTATEWMNSVRANQTKLEKLIRAYHPASPGEKVELPITAPNAEWAAGNVRRSISNKWANKPDPVEYFRKAVERDDWPIVNVVLNDAWFGVPESTSCWNIEGFTEAVKLMEDLPDDSPR